MSFKTRFISLLLFVVMLVSFVFSGCNIMNVSNLGLEELMQPPMPDGEKYKIKLLLDTLVRGSITLVSPKSGNYMDAFAEYDIDHNGQNEVVVFYQEKLNGVTTEYLRVFYKEGDEWKTNESIPVGEDDVYSLSFYDLNNDNIDEILVLWENSIYEPRSKTLAIYEYEIRNWRSNVEYGRDITLRDTKDCEDFTVVDLQNDGRLEVVTATLEAEAKIYVYKYDSVLSQLGDSVTLKEYIEEDGNIITNGKIEGYASMTSSKMVSIIDGMGKKTEYFPRVMVDCYYKIYGNSEVQLRTYMIYCEKEDMSSDRYKDEPKSFDYVSNVSIRESTITSRDVNNDGIVDLPMLKGFVNTATVDTTGLIVDEHYTDKSMISWKTYDGTGWPISEYTVFNFELNYILTIPEEWVDDIYFEDNSSEGEYIFYKWDAENGVKLDRYVTVKVWYWEAKEDWESQGYTVVGTNEAGTLVYAMRMGTYDGFDDVRLIINK